MNRKHLFQVKAFKSSNTHSYHIIKLHFIDPCLSFGMGVQLELEEKGTQFINVNVGTELILLHINYKNHKFSSLSNIKTSVKYIIF